MNTTHTTFESIRSRENKRYDLPIRIVRIKICDILSENILTNFPRDEFPSENIKERYKLRWVIETSFKELKYNRGFAKMLSKK